MMKKGIATCLEKYRERRDFFNSFPVLELQDFLFPNCLEGQNREDLIRGYRRELTGFNGRLALHGPYLDLVPISLDPGIRAVTRKRYQQALDLARELEASWVVIHSSFQRDKDNPSYRSRWVEANLNFWEGLLPQVESSPVTVVLENVHDPHPALLGELVKDLASPSFKACLDVGHAHVFSPVSLEDWLQALGSHLAYLHLSDNDGEGDQHLAPGKGFIEWDRLRQKVKELNQELVAVSEAFCPLEEAGSFLSWFTGT